MGNNLFNRQRGSAKIARAMRRNLAHHCVQPKYSVEEADVQPHAADVEASVQLVHQGCDPTLLQCARGFRDAARSVLRLQGEAGASSAAKITVERADIRPGAHHEEHVAWHALEERRNVGEAELAEALA
eukprot:CAMPEP_0182847808 /NCGR_PEP_ID=MMETSP0006_2-20121128/28658_1 /TAXON_ID=97485 /ORGANISM="Prymnesium parvum, Strain Texoma1" /LENGTH=128 /DNA_ID=CAMNT_0024978171 /DNA_START=209 /DNA_END=595 /DNA_ORIENTATION=+